jgi:uncharacterized membrane protein
MSGGKSALGLDANITALIGYPIGLVALILIFIEKDNKWVRFHAFQSLLFWVAVTIIYVALGIFAGVFFAISSTLGFLMSSLIGLFGLVVLVGVIFLAYKAYQNEKFKLPVLGDMAEKWS